MEPGVQTWEADRSESIVGLPDLSATIYRLLLRSGRNMRSGWDGLIEKSWGRKADTQGKMHMLNSYHELS